MKKIVIIFMLLNIAAFVFAKPFELAYNDGPYVFWEDDVPHAYYIINDEVICDTLSKNIDGEYYLNWAEGTYEPVKLLTTFPEYKTSYDCPEEFLVISDQHGNLQGTIELLQAGGVIDDNYNWVYPGWLIIAGDIFDRGEHTTELLWFIYTLWQQAEQSQNGKMIITMGNHETMVLAERTHKVIDKYQKTCELMDMTYNQLYGKDTFMGRWVRSWQTVLALDNYLILHAGISPGVKDTFSSLDQINSAVTAYYNDNPLEDIDYSYLFHRNGPFWYRGYFYSEEKWETSNQEVINDILAKYNLSKIIVGHTTFKDIGYNYNESIINIDAGLKYQESGKALLYKNDQFQIMDSQGNNYNLSENK